MCGCDRELKTDSVYVFNVYVFNIPLAPGTQLISRTSSIRRAANRPRLHTRDRLFWIALLRLWRDDKNDSGFKTSDPGQESSQQQSYFQLIALTAQIDVPRMTGAVKW